MDMSLSIPLAREDMSCAINHTRYITCRYGTNGDDDAAAAAAVNHLPPTCMWPSVPRRPGTPFPPICMGHGEVISSHVDVLPDPMNGNPAGALSPTRAAPEKEASRCKASSGLVL